MVPTIGIMVGLYVITKMLDFIIPKKDGKTSGVVQIFAVITILFTFFAIYSLYTSGIDLSSILC
jgi:hypothetical protein